MGDAIGSGKTVVTIALILSGIEEARANRSMADGRSGATLIVVPPGLVKQWDDERKVREVNICREIYQLYFFSFALTHCHVCPIHPMYRNSPRINSKASSSTLPTH